MIDMKEILNENIFFKLKNKIKKQLNFLSYTMHDREVEVLFKYLGLNDDNKFFTLQEIADEYNVSRERIRQIFNKAILKIKKAIRNYDLKDYISDCIEIRGYTEKPKIDEIECEIIYAYLLGFFRGKI